MKWSNERETSEEIPWGLVMCFWKYIFWSNREVIRQNLETAVGIKFEPDYTSISMDKVETEFFIVKNCNLVYDFSKLTAYFLCGFMENRNLINFFMNNNSS